MTAAETSREETPEQKASLSSELQTMRVQAQLNWRAPEQLPVRFANNVFGMLQEDYFIVTFGHTELPLRGHLSEDELSEMVVAGVPVTPVARLVISPGSMGRILQELTRLYQRWEQIQQEAMKQASGGVQPT